MRWNEVEQRLDDEKHAGDLRMVSDDAGPCVSHASAMTQGPCARSLRHAYVMTQHHHYHHSTIIHTTTSAHHPTSITDVPLLLLLFLHSGEIWYGLTSSTKHPHRYSAYFIHSPILLILINFYSVRCKQVEKPEEEPDPYMKSPGQVKEDVCF